MNYNDEGFFVVIFGRRTTVILNASGVAAKSQAAGISQAPFNSWERVEQQDNSLLFAQYDALF